MDKLESQAPVLAFQILRHFVFSICKTIIALPE